MAYALKQMVEHYLSPISGTGFLRTAIDGLYLVVATEPIALYHQLYRPAICVTLQGLKQARVADRVLAYGPGQALAARIDSPAIGSVVQASSDKPYLGLMLALDLEVLREIAASTQGPCADASLEPGLFVIDVGGDLEHALQRLLRLLAVPDAIPLLTRGIIREIAYWLLAGPKGESFAELALAGTRSRGVMDAISLLRGRFTEPLCIAELAETSGMSLSSFHSHFKSLTGATPLQYQKQLRLFEARRLMLDEAMNVSASAYKVGYESVSQFIREYARLFRATPKQDILVLQQQGHHRALAKQ
ncbi:MULTISPECIES: AraC family transcriptional regulator [unclassified Pseudomonas]|uniref:AraC family transcriptional regulator n=1 Tax=unclassified Pseudomonas TaxID=196821 RepID=UPI001302618A|nr:MULTISPECIES: AraC family transcriptional regulator [unclassified Pseudomonas]